MCENRTRGFLHLGIFTTDRATSGDPGIFFTKQLEFQPNPNFGSRDPDLVAPHECMYSHVMRIHGPMDDNHNATTRNTTTRNTPPAIHHPQYNPGGLRPLEAVSQNVKKERGALLFFSLSDSAAYNHLLVS